TQEDIKEIIEYADKRGIMIVPEIDFPAHCAAAIAAYPWLACRELNREVPGYFGGIIPELKLKMMDWNRTICVGKDKTLEMVFDIIDEICELFPAPYFHIGGDEAPKNEWKKCPECQKRIKENNLKDEEALQGWFNNLILEHLKKKGKRLIGWNEIFKAVNLDKSVIGQYWTPKRDKRAEEFVNNGGQMIMSNHQSFYFDMTYGQYSLKNTYDFTPAKFKVSNEGVKNVLGVEGDNWTEWVDTEEKLQLQMFPRVQALAEVAWTDESHKNWNEFKTRLDDFKPYFEHFGINYAVDKVSLPTNIFTKIKIQKKFFKGDTHLELKLNEKYKSQGEK
ncbi:MAG: family 20 glycosylhydrolase, partial [Eubacterium sp.]